MLTYFLAALLGWYFVIMSLFLIFRRDVIVSAMQEIMTQRGLLLIVGFITLLIGLLLVLTHNFWVMGWPVIITIVAWIALISGLIRLFFPEVMHKIWGRMAAHPNYFTITGVVFLVIGLFLLFHVYYV